jgi:hypothetical protein
MLRSRENRTANLATLRRSRNSATRRAYWLTYSDPPGEHTRPRETCRDGVHTRDHAKRYEPATAPRALHSGQRRINREVRQSRASDEQGASSPLRSSALRGSASGSDTGRSAGHLVWPPGSQYAPFAAERGSSSRVAAMHAPVAVGEARLAEVLWRAVAQVGGRVPGNASRFQLLGSGGRLGCCAAGQRLGQALEGPAQNQYDDQSAEADDHDVIIAGERQVDGGRVHEGVHSDPRKK